MNDSSAGGVAGSTVSPRPHFAVMSDGPRPPAGGERVVGVDIGGANVKFASTDGRRWSEPLPMWRTPGALPEVLRRNLLGPGPSGGDAVPDRLLVTMTGELVDAFATRWGGVESITASVDSLGMSEVWYYTVDGNFIRPAEVRRDPIRVAAANFHATAAAYADWLAGHGAISTAVIVDIGSTTTDITAVSARRVETDARCDAERLARGQLVYVGRRRTPIASIVDDLVMPAGSTKLLASTTETVAVPVMREWFATIDDAALLLGIAPESVDDCDTANGRPRTVVDAATRMLRMVGTDLDDHRVRDAVAMAGGVMTAARRWIRAGIDRQPPGPVIFLNQGSIDDAAHWIDVDDRHVWVPPIGSVIDPTAAMLYLDARRRA